MTRGHGIARPRRRVPGGDPATSRGGRTRRAVRLHRLRDRRRPGLVRRPARRVRLRAGRDPRERSRVRLRHVCAPHARRVPAVPTQRSHRATCTPLRPECDGRLRTSTNGDGRGFDPRTQQGTHGPAISIWHAGCSACRSMGKDCACPGGHLGGDRSHVAPSAR